MLLRCEEEVRERSCASFSSYREKFVVIHQVGSSILKAVKVHPLASLEDAVLLPLSLSKVSVSPEAQERKAMIVLK